MAQQLGEIQIDAAAIVNRLRERNNDLEWQKTVLEVQLEEARTQVAQLSARLEEAEAEANRHMAGKPDDAAE